MAERAAVPSKVKGHLENARVITWTLTANNDTGAWIENPTFSDRSVQVEAGGGLGFSGGTVTIEGCNDLAKTPHTLTDTAAGAATFTSGGIKQLLQVTRYIRPKVTGAVTPNVIIDLLIVGKNV